MRKCQIFKREITDIICNEKLVDGRSDGNNLVRLFTRLRDVSDFLTTAVIVKLTRREMAAGF